MRNPPAENNITSLLAYLLSAGGFRIGYCNTEGIFIQGHHLFKHKANDIVSIQDVLFEPTIEMAVLECSSEEIMRSGLGFDRCDTAIISGISPEVHLVKNIDSVEEAAKLKKVLLDAVQPGGHIILNANDEHVHALADVTDRKVSFYSSKSSNKNFAAGDRSGAWIAYMENNTVQVKMGVKSVNFPSPAPAQENGTILPAVLCALAQGMDGFVIRDALNMYYGTPSSKRNRFRKKDEKSSAPG
jgi:cyanophycin synthetase